jgi:GTP-binding protein EngB required for normal cell division
MRCWGIPGDLSLVIEIFVSFRCANLLLPEYLLVRRFHVYLAGACNVGKSTLASIPIGEEISCLL